MNTVILGCGRVGAQVACRLSPAHRVAVIDWNPSSFDRLPSDFAGDTVIGNGLDGDVLRNAGVEDADLFIALTDGDNRNLMSAQVALRIGAQRAIARVYDAVRSEIFTNENLTTLSPTIRGAERMFELIVNMDERS